MAEFKPNETKIQGLLHSPGGAVYKHVQEFMREGQRIAKLEAPKETGTLAASTRAVGPVSTASGVEGTIRADAINPRTGQNYAAAVHQGHGTIVPTTKPYLKFYWSRKRSYVVTQSVAPRAGRPFLWQGLVGANQSLRAGFKLTVKRPWRTDGS